MNLYKYRENKLQVFTKMVVIFYEIKPYMHNRVN